MGEVIGGRRVAFYRQARSTTVYVCCGANVGLTFSTLRPLCSSGGATRRVAPFRAGPRRRADTSRVTCASVGVLRMQRTADAEGNAGERARGPSDENKNQSVNRMKWKNNRSVNETSRRRKWERWNVKEAFTLLLHFDISIFASYKFRLRFCYSPIIFDYYALIFIFIRGPLAKWSDLYMYNLIRWFSKDIQEI